MIRTAPWLATHLLVLLALLALLMLGGVPRVVLADLPAAGSTPDPFPGPDRVTLARLLPSLDAMATRKESEPAYRAAFTALQAERGLAAEEYQAFVRVRMLFEATRDGGLWGLRWAITDRAPQSDAIWAQWQAWTEPVLPGQDPFEAHPSAVAECDELSALFAFLVRRLGVKHVGLFWPTSNHTVAVWTASGPGGAVRVVVPTSQIFLDPKETLGTRTFDPAHQRTIYDYGRADVPDDYEIPAPLARAFIYTMEAAAGLSNEDLQARRNARSAAYGGS